MTATADLNTWEQRAAALQVDGRAIIDGDLVDAASGETFARVSPVDGRQLGQVVACDTEDVDLAVKAARKAFDGGVWSELAPRDRKNLMLDWAALIFDHAEELGLLATLEMGKAISEGVGEAQHTARVLTYYAEAIDKVYGQVAPTPPGGLALITREPVGVVGAVTPWNYPLYIPVLKAAPALATGNSVVLKPAEQTPLTALRVGQLALQAGIPAGVLNVLTGFGETAGRAIGLHPDVDVICFTGSTHVGKRFLQYSGESNMKAVWLECGGKSPNVVLADADLERAASIITDGVFDNTGQLCSAGTRLIVERAVAEDLLGRIIENSKSWRPVHPFQADARMGAIVDKTQFDRVLGYIDSGKEEANLICGGNRALEETGGLYIEPTIFEDPTANAKITREEIFGPVLTVIPVDDAEQGIKIANDTEYGLNAGVWTRDIGRAFRVAKAMRAGNVAINTYDKGDFSVPSATAKQSGIGIDKSLHAMNQTTYIKSTWVNIAD